MRRLAYWLACVTAVLFVGHLVAAEVPPLLLGQGVVQKVDHDTLTIRTREPDGRFGKTLALHLTGTSKLTTLTVVTRGGKSVLTQRDIEARDLEPKQSITFIYTTLKGSSVLLSAVVQPAEEK